jgi:spore germination protein
MPQSLNVESNSSTTRPVSPTPFSSFVHKTRRFIAVIGVASLSIVAGAVEAPATQQAPRRVSAWLPYWDNRAIDDFAANADLYDQILPFWFEMRSTTSVVPYENANDQRLMDIARAAGVRVLPTITNDFDPVRLRQMLSTDSNIDAHVQTLLSLAGPFDGLDIDYESGYATDRARFTVFATRLANALHNAGKLLSMTVHPKTSEPGTWDGPQSQDWAALGSVSDRFRVMAYDYHWATSSAGGVAPLSWVDNVVKFAVTQVPASKVVLGIPLYGYDWVGQSGEGLTWDTSEARRKTYGATLRRSSDGSEPWYQYRSQGKDHTVWYSDAVSTAPKLAVADTQNLAGVTLWRLGGEDPRLWDTVRAWATGPRPDPVVTPLPIVRGVKAGGRVRGVGLRWEPVKTTSAVRYIVLRSPRSDGSLKRIGHSKSSSFVDDGLKRGKRYWYALRAIDADGNRGRRSPKVSAVTR